MSLTLKLCGYVAVIGVIVTSALSLIGGVSVLWGSWRHARAVIRQTQAEARERASRDASAWRDGEPVPYWPASLGDDVLTLTCRWCTTMTGSCTCPGRCQTPGCRGEWTTSLAVLTPADVELLRASGIKGWTEQ